MAWSVGRTIFIAGIVGVAAIAITYTSSPADITDLKLVSIEAARLKDIPPLAGQTAPDTPVFRVRFSTRSDLVALANGLDAYTVRAQVLAGEAGCNPALKTITYARVAFMLIDFTRVYDDSGGIEGRGVFSRDDADSYHFYFGVTRSEFPEFVASGLREAPLCFALTGTSRMGRNLSSNIVPLPADVIAEAAARLSPS